MNIEENPKGYSCAQCGHYNHIDTIPTQVPVNQISSDDYGLEIEIWCGMGLLTKVETVTTSKGETVIEVSVDIPEDHDSAKMFYRVLEELIIIHRPTTR